MFNIPNITEHKATTLFDEKFGKDKVTRFSKVREEFNEMIDAFVEYLETGNDEHLRDELCDLQGTLSHFASLFELYQQEMLHASIDKVIQRETNPEYKRYSSVRNIRNVGIIGGIGSISPFEAQLELLAYHLENENRVIIIGEGSPEDVKSKDEILSKFEKMKRIEMEVKAPPMIYDCKSVEPLYEPREPKPWDRKEIHRHSKSSYKSKRRK